MTAQLPSYISVPTSARPIAAPDDPAPGPESSRPSSAHRPSFPPLSGSGQQQTSSASAKKFAVPTSSLSSNVSDLLLSSLLPPNLPKLPPSVNRSGDGRARELSTQREALSLPLVSNNFRRFVTKVGPLFWVQDRIEEVLFWRKPTWTYAYILAWGFISFNPRLLLLLPSATLILILLHNHERNNPLPSLLGVVAPPPAAGTMRVSAGAGQDGGTTFSASTVEKDTGAIGGAVPVVPPKEAESGVDYYLNIQAIQNLMGLVSDAYDYLAPRLTILNSPAPSTTSTSFPITTTHLILVLLPPSLLLPLLPSWAVSYLIFALGLAPPLFFHPNLTPAILNLPRHPAFLRLRQKLERLVVVDSLSNDMGRKQISQVEVWENERLDPAVASKPTTTPSVWGSRFLRSGERAPWVKIYNEHSKWKPLGQGRQVPLTGGAEKGEEGSEVVLALEEGWAFLPSEDWRVDVCGFWSSVGSDPDGWAYTDDSWQNPSITPIVETDATMGPQRKVTRRRRWYRPVYHDEPHSSAAAGYRVEGN